MMHMWLWWGYDLGDFLFSGLAVSSRWAFALTWLALFVFALLFEASKVYLARVQREAQKRLYPYRSDERRNLLCEREQSSVMEATTSRNTSEGPVSRWVALRIRMLVNLHQSSIFVAHNTAGYLLMLAVMVYNAYLLLAVVLGMTLGYFLFGTKLTRLQMQCFSTKRVVICTPECDDTAEGSTPPLLGAASSSESDFFICQTRTCIQPSHYFPATSRDGGEPNATCFYGARRCPSKVARAKKMQPSCSRSSEETEDALLKTEGCCKKPEPVVEEKKCCGKKSSQIQVETTVSVHGASEEREETPPVTCCSAQHAPTDSQQQIV